MKRLQNKKGAVIEMAIVFMLVTFALCSMLVTVAFASTVRNTNAYNNANDHFSIDQIGEYFLRGLQERSTVDFMQDVPAGKENDTNYVRGGWTKFIITDEEFEESVMYGINIGKTADYKANGKYTLRIAEWEKIPTNGKNVEQNAIKLIVTVQKDTTYEGKTAKSTYKILNWSNQPLTGDALINDALESDTPEPQRSWRDAWRALWERWTEFFKSIRRTGKYRRSRHH